MDRLALRAPLGWSVRADHATGGTRAGPRSEANREFAVGPHAWGRRRNAGHPTIQSCASALCVPTVARPMARRKGLENVVSGGGACLRTAPRTAAPGRGRSGCAARPLRRRAGRLLGCGRVRRGGDGPRPRAGQHPFDAGQVEAGVGEVLDALEQIDVGVGVATAAALGASRIDQALALVDAKGLRVDAGQLGRDRDDVHGMVGRTAHVAPPSGDEVNRCVRGDSVAAAASASMAARSSSDSLAGTATSTPTNRSPVRLGRGDAAALDPERATGAGAGGDADLDRAAVDGGHVDVGAQRRLGEGDRGR